MLYDFRHSKPLSSTTATANKEKKFCLANFGNPTKNIRLQQHGIIRTQINVMPDAGAAASLPNLL